MHYKKFGRIVIVYKPKRVFDKGFKINTVKLILNIEIRFRNKINKTQYDYFPITAKLKRILLVLKYLADKREKNSNKLFSTSAKSKKNVYTKLTAVENSLGIKKECRGTHGIRKLFSQELFDAEDDLKIEKCKIVELMRHKDSKTTDKHYRVFKAK